jgi:hypothetical protein
VNVIIKIEGREAIPVRAMPLLTDWQTVTPDMLAAALSGDQHFFHLAAMQAYRVVNGKAVPRRWWTNYVSEPLQALSDEIRATETTRTSGKEQWKFKSLEKLPAGVYVWRDEFERAYQRRYGKATLPLDFEDKDVQLTDAESATLTAAHQERIALDYAPFINDELRTLVLEGFLPGTDLSLEPALIPDSATPVAMNGKKWTDEKLAELNAFREGHTMPETAAKFGITEQRIGQLLPSGKPKAKPFAGLVHRIK